jgi:hypothetical protein
MGVRGIGRQAWRRDSDHMMIFLKSSAFIDPKKSLLPDPRHFSTQSNLDKRIMSGAHW